MDLSFLVFFILLASHAIVTEFGQDNYCIISLKKNHGNSNKISRKNFG